MMMESYVRNAPKRHELYRGNIETRRYACHEYGDRCGEWIVGEALKENGHALPQVFGSAPDEKDDSKRIALLLPMLPVSDSR